MKLTSVGAADAADAHADGVIRQERGPIVLSPALSPSRRRVSDSSLYPFIPPPANRFLPSVYQKLKKYLE